MKRADHIKSNAHNLTRPARRTPELEAFLKRPVWKPTQPSDIGFDRTYNIR